MTIDRPDLTCCVCLEVTEQRGGKPLYSSGCCGSWLHLECAYSIARSSTCSKTCPLCRAQIILPYVPPVLAKRRFDAEDTDLPPLSRIRSALLNTHREWRQMRDSTEMALFGNNYRVNHEFNYDGLAEGLSGPHRHRDPAPLQDSLTPNSAEDQGVQARRRSQEVQQILRDFAYPPGQTQEAAEGGHGADAAAVNRRHPWRLPVGGWGESNQTVEEAHFLGMVRGRNDAGMSMTINPITAPYRNYHPLPALPSAMMVVNNDGGASSTREGPSEAAPNMESGPPQDERVSDTARMAPYGTWTGPYHPLRSGRMNPFPAPPRRTRGPVRAALRAALSGARFAAEPPAESVAAPPSPPYPVFDLGEPDFGVPLWENYFLEDDSDWGLLPSAQVPAVAIPAPVFTATAAHNPQDPSAHGTDDNARP